MWQRFTESGRKVIFYAQEEAQRFGEGYISTEHILLGLIREPQFNAASIIVKMGMSLNSVRQEVERQLPRGDARPNQDMTLTPRAKRVIDFAYDEARLLGSDCIDTEYLLLGLIREGEGLAGRVLKKLGIELENTREQIDKTMPIKPKKITLPVKRIDTFVLLPPRWGAICRRAENDQYEISIYPVSTSGGKETVELNKCSTQLTVPRDWIDIVRKTLKDKGGKPLRSFPPFGTGKSVEFIAEDLFKAVCNLQGAE
jgi:hypothetical protein